MSTVTREQLHAYLDDALGLGQDFRLGWWLLFRAIRLSGDRRFLGFVGLIGFGASVLPMIVSHGEPWTILSHGALWGIAAGGYITLNNMVWPNYYGREFIGAIRGIVLPVSVVASGADGRARDLAAFLRGRFRLLVWFSGDETPETASASVEMRRRDAAARRARGDAQQAGRLLALHGLAVVVDDVEEGRLNIDQIQRKQAEKEAETANSILPRIARESFKWLLCPTQDNPTATSQTVESFQLNTSSGTPISELERVCKENELIIDVWSPIHLRTKLKELYWKGGKDAVSAATFWEDSLKYLYLPRFKSRDVLNLAIKAGAATTEFFGTAYGQNGTKYEGFKLGRADISVDDTLLLIEPEAAKKYALENTPTPQPVPTPGGVGEPPLHPPGGSTVGGVPAPPASPAQAKAFHGSVEVNPTLAKSKLNSIAEEVINLLTQDPNATVKVTVEIAAEFPNGASDTIKRSVSENTSNLGFKVRGWE